MKSIYLTAIASLLLASSIVTAKPATQDVIASVGEASGMVLVKRDGKRVDVKKGTHLLNGDELYVFEGASANITYTNAKCNVKVSPNMSLTVSSTNACATPQDLGKGAPIVLGLVSSLGVAGAVALAVVSVVVVNEVVVKDDDPVSGGNPAN